MKELLNEIKRIYGPHTALATHTNNRMNQGLANTLRSHFSNVSGKLMNKIFFSKISSATGYADIIFQKNNFVRIAASVIYLHVASCFKKVIANFIKLQPN